jgi:hypothetical protein
MKKAILINRIEQLDYWNKSYSRVYFGNEFCMKLLPSDKECEKIIRFINDKKLKLTLIIPFTNDIELLKMKKFIKRFKNVLNCDEVVCNDFGVLHFLKRTQIKKEVILGRVLKKFHNLWLKKDFSDEYGIKKVEIDYLFSDYKKARGSLKEKIKPGSNFSKSKYEISFYYPYTLVFDTRWCVFCGLFSSDYEKIKGITNSCNKECLSFKNGLEMKHVRFKKILLKGRAQFICQKTRTMKEIKREAINRYVFQPEIPV